jgi:hypothetical protein
VTHTDQAELAGNEARWRWGQLAEGTAL